MPDVVLLAVAFVVILAGAELFTNGIEWFGHKVGLGEGAVGSVLAAVGTALPETMIPLIAILFATGDSSREVGLGAILGAPFMLSTLAMFVTGAAVLAFRRRRERGTEMLVDPRVLVLDVRTFAIAYGLAVATAFLPASLQWPKLVAAVVLIGIYAWYVKRHLAGEATIGEEGLRPLRFDAVDPATPSGPHLNPRFVTVVIQVVVALGLIVGGAFVFVGAVQGVAASLGVEEVLLALVIAPVATELPEKFNSILWVRQGKDTLAMGNITGAMVFQSTIPTVIALVFATSTWTFSESSSLAFASALIAFLSVGAIFLPLARRGRLAGGHLLVGGLFYLAFVSLVVASMAGLLG